MKKTRGEYRPIYTALWDGADFQQLSSAARFVLVALKGKLHATGIQVVPGVIEACSEWTGLTPRACTKALAELESHSWLRRERSLVWVVRGFEFEPTWDASNWRHRKHIQRYAQGLPSSAIVQAWRERYAAWFTEKEQGGGHSLSDSHSDRLSEGDGQGHRKSLDLSTSPTPVPTTSPPSARTRDTFRDDPRWLAFASSIPEAKHPAFVALVTQWAEGERWGAAPRPTLDHVLDGLLAAVTAKDQGPLGEAFIRGCIKRVMQGERVAPVPKYGSFLEVAAAMDAEEASNAVA